MQAVKFSNNVIVKEEILDKASDCALSAIEKELPEEALSYETYEFVISKCLDKLKQKRIVL